LAKSPLLPPRGERKPGERRSLTPQRPAFSIWYVLGLLLLLAVAQAWFLGTGGRSIPYSEFKTLLRANQVSEVTVGDQTIGGKLKEARGEGRQRSDAFMTTRIEDPKLVEDLEAHQVKYTGEVVSRWLPEILGWVIPLLLLVALWSFFFRRMGGAEGGVMSFARSRAKIYADDDVKVSFADVAGVDEAEDELREIVEFLKNPKKYTTLGATFPRACCWSVLRARARRCWRAPWPARRRCRFSASAGPSSSRCSSASARRACAICSSRPRPSRRVSCSSTSSMPWARRACRARWAATKNGSRP
jgi:hypothetical protein